MKMKKFKGIALIQVLLLVAIITVFILYLSTTVKSQIHLANLAQQKAQAEVNNHSIYNQLLFTLLTEDKVLDINSDNEIATKWNFYNKPFKINGTEIRIQDQAGLLNIQYVVKPLLVATLIQSGIEAERAEYIWAHLLDWQDADSIPRPNGSETSLDKGRVRNGYIADISEIEYIVNLTELEKEILLKSSTMFYVGDLNPMTAPLSILKTLMPKDVANSVIQLRNENRQNLSNFLNLSGLSFEDGLRYNPSNRIAISIESGNGEVELKRELVLSISPYAKGEMYPFNILLDRN